MWFCVYSIYYLGMVFLSFGGTISVSGMGGHVVGTRESERKETVTASRRLDTRGVVEREE